MSLQVPQDWSIAVGDYVDSPQYKKMLNFVQQQYKEVTVYPEKQNIFAAFSATSFANTKVVILGQDPYHSVGQAMGLSFSVPTDTKIPPSLRNIYKELQQEYGKKSRAERAHGGDLTCWAQQGVLLLNAVLTVVQGNPGSHAGKGWEDFTDHVIQTISDKKQHVAFLLWGKYAAQKVQLIDESKHLILTAPHPSPFSAHRGFLGCDHFKKTNEYLAEHKKRVIKW